MIKKILHHINTILTATIIFGLLGSAATAYISPKYLHVLAFSGFLFPFFWVLNLAFVTVNLIRKNWISLAIGLLAGVITFGHVTDLYQITFSSNSPSKTKTTIQIMSFNTRMFDVYKWTGNANTSEEVLDFIRQQNPDVVCFQEFFTDSRNPKYAEHHIIARLNQFQYRHIEYNVIGKNGKKFGQATFSKYPIVLGKPLLFKNSSNFSIQTDIQVNDKTIRIFNNHLESVKLTTRHYQFLDSLTFKPEKSAGIIEIGSKLKTSLNQRAYQAETIALHIKNSPYPVIVCGDFNDTPVSYVYHTMRGELKDCFDEAGTGFGGTYNGKLPSFRIDFIFHDQSFTATKFRTFNVNFSDHFPLMASIEL
jgi:endonuclease/exonuclease/phosphatase family metal-dependent hydrolase